MGGERGERVLVGRNEMMGFGMGARKLIYGCSERRLGGSGKCGFGKCLWVFEGVSINSFFIELLACIRIVFFVLLYQVS